MITVTSIEPVNHLACPVSIAELGDQEWVLSVSRGGRWEATRSAENLVLIESLVRAVIEGHVSETIRPGGARVTITTSDGKLHKSAIQSSTMVFFAERKSWYRRHDFAPFK
jgi:ribosomal protein S1